MQDVKIMYAHFFLYEEKKNVQKLSSSHNNINHPAYLFFFHNKTHLKDSDSTLIKSVQSDK